MVTPLRPIGMYCTIQLHGASMQGHLKDRHWISKRDCNTAPADVDSLDSMSRRVDNRIVCAILSAEDFTEA